MKNFFIVIGIILFLLFGGLAYRYFTAEIRGKVDAKEHVESGDHRIYSYELFYDMYGNIKSYQTALEAQKENLEYAESSSERSRIRSNISGIKSQLRRAIEEYNAEASKVKTVGKFRSDDLPQKIKFENYIY